MFVFLKIGLNKMSNKDKYTPSQAQRETFRLIDTVKQLDTTLKDMGPTLSEGKKIINMFQKLNL